MPKAKNDTMKIDVVETTVNETRTIAVTMTTQASDFLLADLLRQRGAVGTMDASLKQAMRETVQGYLDGAEELIAGVVTTQKKAGNGTKAKGKGMPEGNEVGAMNGNGNGGEHGRPVKGEAMSETEKGADVLSLE